MNPSKSPIEQFWHISYLSTTVHCNVWILWLKFIHIPVKVKSTAIPFIDVDVFCLRKFIGQKISLIQWRPGSTASIVHFKVLRKDVTKRRHLYWIEYKCFNALGMSFIVFFSLIKYCLIGLIYSFRVLHGELVPRVSHYTASSFSRICLKKQIGESLYVVTDDGSSKHRNVCFL